MANFKDAYYKDPETGLFVPFPYIKKTSTLTTPEEIVAEARKDLIVDPNYVHTDNNFTNAYKSEGAVGTGVINPSPISGKDLSTVKKLTEEFDKMRRLLVEYTVPDDTTSISFEFDRFGNAFDTLNIKRLVLLGNVNSAASGGMGIKINNVVAGYVNGVSTVTAGVAINATAYTNFEITIAAYPDRLFATGNSYRIDLNTNAKIPFYVNCINLSITNNIDKLLLSTDSGANIKAGSVIKIYRND